MNINIKDISEEAIVFFFISGNHLDISWQDGIEEHSTHSAYFLWGVITFASNTLEADLLVHSLAEGLGELDHECYPR